MTKKKKTTSANRQREYVSKGRALSFVLTDPVALCALEELEMRYAGPKAAITAALGFMFLHEKPRASK